MAEERVQRRLEAILAVDVVGYSCRMAKQNTDAPTAQRIEFRDDIHVDGENVAAWLEELAPPGVLGGALT